MKIYVLGASGMLGRYVSTYFKNQGFYVVDINRDKLDASKITQEELAQQLNVSRLTIQHLEAGKNFTIETLLKVLNHFEEMELFFRYLNEKKEILENSKSLY